ncbi:unnamed protein product, partial [Polarella glacialis]
AAEDAEVAAEPWIAQTQQNLGQLITKPRLLADRLRKPPFRFLFDIAVELARQRGFGVAELFGGEVGAKPAVPNSRDDKVVFLEKWIAAVVAGLPSHAADLAL